MQSLKDSNMNAYRRAKSATGSVSAAVRERTSNKAFIVCRCPSTNSKSSK